MLSLLSLMRCRRVHRSLHELCHDHRSFIYNSMFAPESKQALSLLISQIQNGSSVVRVPVSALICSECYEHHVIPGVTGVSIPLNQIRCLIMRAVSWANGSDYDSIIHACPLILSLYMAGFDDSDEQPAKLFSSDPPHLILKQLRDFTGAGSHLTGQTAHCLPHLLTLRLSCFLEKAEDLLSLAQCCPLLNSCSMNAWTCQLDDCYPEIGRAHV